MSFPIFTTIYALVVFGALFVAIQWLKGKRRPKLPFKPERDRLLRGPGESLKQRIDLMDENLIYSLMGLMVLPILTGAGIFIAMRSTHLGSEGVQLVVPLLGAGTVIVVGALYVAKEAVRRGNHYLGWFGERMTAEELEPMKARGWQIFHDVPVSSGKAEWNIDHVAVGPGGVFAIETKMRRKGHARHGRKDHEVFYDGSQLSWPWTEDRYGLAQAEKNARELGEWLEQLTNVNIKPTAVLTFPGWYIVERALGPVRVVNGALLPSLLGAKSGVLSAAQIDLVSRQLEARCRDVQY